MTSCCIVGGYKNPLTVKDTVHVIVLILPDEQEYTIVLLGLATFINVLNVAGGDLSRMLGKGDQQALCNEAVLIGNGILGFMRRRNIRQCSGHWGFSSSRADEPHLHRCISGRAGSWYHDKRRYTHPGIFQCQKR